MFLFLIIWKNICSQDISKLNGFKYVFVSPIEYQDGQNDKYGVRNIVVNNLSSTGIKLINQNLIPPDVLSNPCIALDCIISHTNALGVRDWVTLQFYDCNDNLVLETKGRSGTFVYSVAQELVEAAESACKDFKKFRYKYDDSKSVSLVLPEVERVEENESYFIQYYRDSLITPIEGIYKTMSNNSNDSYYKLAIKKYGSMYKAILLETNYDVWKKGEVKAYFESSSIQGVYSVRWLRGDKNKQETIAKLENNTLITIQLKNENGNADPIQLIKMYPNTEANTNEKKSRLTTGSGFFLTIDGLIATNAHVVEGSKKITIKVVGENGVKSYNTKLELKDSKNDVAILRIIDTSFKLLNSIPYSLIDNAEIGEKTFTIGFPLNDVMGTNFKVTDGIISSLSGIQDDIRYMQMTVPVQPGNSGGPLFNRDGDIIGITSAKLNPLAVGTTIENVNYAIKSSYLINLINMLPVINTGKKGENKIKGIELKEQIKVLKNYVCIVEVSD